MSEFTDPVHGWESFYSAIVGTEAAKRSCINLGTVGTQQHSLLTHESIPPKLMGQAFTAKAPWGCGWTPIPPFWQNNWEGGPDGREAFSYGHRVHGARVSELADTTMRSFSPIPLFYEHNITVFLACINKATPPAPDTSLGSAEILITYRRGEKITLPRRQTLIY